MIKGFLKQIKKGIIMLMDIFLNFVFLMGFVFIIILFISIIKGVQAAKKIKSPDTKIKVSENIVSKIKKEKKQ